MANQKTISRKTKLEDDPYKWGFELDIDSETAPKGINPDWLVRWYVNPRQLVPVLIFKKQEHI